MIKKFLMCCSCGSNPELDIPKKNTEYPQVKLDKSNESNTNLQNTKMAQSMPIISRRLDISILKPKNNCIQKENSTTSTTSTIANTAPIIKNSLIANSVINNSTIENSTIENSFVENLSVSNSVIKNSIIQIRTKVQKDPTIVLTPESSKITINSTVSTITLNSANIINSPNKTSSSKKNLNAHNPNYKNHLICDDSSVNRKLLRQFLYLHNCNVVEAENGQDCINKVLENNNYSVIWMDVIMPIMGGIDATANLVKLDGFKSVIIGLTGSVDDVTIKQCYGAGMTKVLSKPFNHNSIREICKLY